MRFAIYGAGAVGALLGAKLDLAGEDVTLLARGPHLLAMQEQGVLVHSAGNDITAYPRITGDPNEIKDIDVLVLSVKAHSLTSIAPFLGPMIGPNTIVLPAQNGIPWWYFQYHGGIYGETTLESVDPGGIIARAVPSDCIIGCVVYPAAVISAPGVIDHIEGDRFSLGELDGSTSERLRAVSGAIGRAGLRAPMRSNIRQDIWVKLLGNMAFNPISALTKATMKTMASDEHVSTIIRAMMEEAQAVATALGITIPLSIEQRMKGALNVGEHKTSMLQDLEARKPTEIEALVGSVLELANLTGIPMPHTSSIYACARLLGLSLAKT